MAIKIKKKGSDDSEEPVEESIPEVPEAVGQGYSVGASSGNWLEENPLIFLGGVVAIVVAVIGVYFGFAYMEQERVEASKSLTPAYTAYDSIVKGTREYEAIEANEELPTPENAFESEEAKWQQILDSSNAALDKHGDSELARAARLTKAAALMKLGKVEEAVAAYEEAKAVAANDSEKVAVHQGLLTAYSDQKKWDEALGQLEALAELDETLAEALRYQHARLLEKSGKVEKAKEIYHAIIENEPMHPQKSDIERRLATL